MCACTTMYVTAAVTLLLGSIPLTHQTSASPNRTAMDWKLGKQIACIGGAKVKVSRTRLRLNHQIFSTNTNSSPTYVRVIRLYCRTGYLMEAWNKKNIRGTTNTKSNRTWFEMQSFGRSIVRLRNRETGRYLAITWRGRPTTQGHLRQESLFKIKLEKNGFHSFASHKYYRRHRHDLFIGIKKNGSFKSPITTLPGQTAVQFMVLHHNH